MTTLSDALKAHPEHALSAILNYRRGERERMQTSAEIAIAARKDVYLRAVQKQPLLAITNAALAQIEFYRHAEEGIYLLLREADFRINWLRKLLGIQCREWFTLTSDKA
jgi:hypothetical protein